MAESVRERVHRIVASVLGVPAAAVDDNTSPDTVSTWDSMQHLQLVLALEEEFDVRFEVDEIEAMQRVGVMMSVLEARAAAR